MMKFSLAILCFTSSLSAVYGKTKSTKSSKSQSPTLAPTTSSPSVSSNPTSFPSSSPSEIPSTEPSIFPSLGPTATLDLIGPRCDDVSFDVLFKSFKGVASDYGEDVNDNGVLDTDEDVNADGVLNDETGIYDINVTSSFNLVLNYSFIVGDRSVVINGFPEDTSLPANGTIVASDGAGKTCFFEVDLQPMDEAFFDEQMEFPSLVYRKLFGRESPSLMPEYFSTEIEASVGNYTAKNDVGEGLIIAIVEILPENSTLISAEDLEKFGLEDPELSSDELQQLEDLGLSGFFFTGSFEKNLTSENVTAYAYSTDTKSPEYSIFVIGAAEGSLFDDKSLELDGMSSELEANFDSTKSLNAIQNEFLSTRRRLREGPFELQNSLSIQNELRTKEGAIERSLSTCSAQPKECKCGTKPNTACIAAAIAAAEKAWKAALKAYEIGMLTLKQAYELGKKKIAEWYKKKLKKDVLACLLACVIFPPSCAGCAARIAVKLLATVALKTAALVLAYEKGKKQLEDLLEKAKEGFACQVEKAYAFVSVINDCSSFISTEDCPTCNSTCCLIYSVWTVKNVKNATKTATAIQKSIQVRAHPLGCSLDISRTITHLF